MDPRTAAKVTAPDLLKAFTEGTGQPVDADEVVALTFWLVLVDGNDVVSVESYDVNNLNTALLIASGHLTSGDGKGAMFFAGTEEPPIVDDARKAISDGSGD